MELLDEVTAEIKELQIRYEKEWKILEETFRRMQDLKHRKRMILKRKIS